MRLPRSLVFAAVGAIGIGVQLLALAWLTRGLGLHYLIATALAVEAAVLHNFFWHERWTWRDRPSMDRAGRLARLLKFHLANGLFSVAGNLVFMTLLVRGLHLEVMVANPVAIGATAVFNFLASDRWVFARRSALGARAAGPVRRVVLAAMLLVTIEPRARAAELRPETLAAWTRYVRATEARIIREERAPYRLLADRRAALLLARLREGEVIVEKMGTRDLDGRDIDVPGGLIHHWRGTVFLRGLSLDDLIAATRAPEQTARQQPDVLEVRVLERHGDTFRLYLKVERRSVITVTYNTEYLVQGTRRSVRTATSRSVATKISEIEDAGTPAERERPRGNDRGFLWRLNAYWRYEQVDGGVIAELESTSLSRTVPLGLATLVRPIIDREARKSITATLLAFRSRFSWR